MLKCAAIAASRSFEVATRFLYNKSVKMKEKIPGQE